MQFGGIHEGAWFSASLFCMETLHVVFEPCFDLWDLLVLHGLALWSSAVDHTIFLSYFKCFPFTCILSLSLIWRLFALAQIFPDKVFTEPNMGGRESIFPSLCLWSLILPCVFFPFPLPCNCKCELCLPSPMD